MPEIRKIRRSDEAAVKALIHGVLENEFPGDSRAYSYEDLDDLVDHYDGKGEVFFVAEKDGRLVGTVGIKRDGPETAMLRRIFVEKRHRGKGYGEKLLDAAIRFCTEQKYDRITFRGTNRMQTAIQLCTKKGFETDGISELGDLDLVILSKKL